MKGASALSLRAAFQLIVLVGAVVPLAVVGVWLTNDTARSGRALLQTQLDTAAVSIAASVDARWQTRRGELALLSENEVIRRVLSQGRVPSGADSAYLASAAAAVQSAIPTVNFTDDAGRSVWSATALPTVDDVRAMTVEPQLISVTQPVARDDGTRIGKLVAQVRLSSLVTSQEIEHLGAGMSMTVTLPGEPLPLRAASAQMTRRTINDPPMTLTLSAASDPYVRPFELAARKGLSVLAVVSLLALIASSLLSNRLTRSLDRLADAADAVAAGDLQREVAPSGPRESVRLSTAFNSMTASLRATLAEISRQKSLAAVGEFAASLSHEVRNSLTAIRIDLQHASKHVPAENAAAPLLARTLGTVRRLDSTVTGALRVARTGRTNPTRVSLRTVLERAMRAAGAGFAASGGTLEPIAHEFRDIQIEGDEAALEQLFLNLLLNAGQALAPGGRARIEIEESERQVVVRVVDTGAGIDASHLDHVGTSLWSSKPDGTGLGLPIARRIAEAHGGGITLTSEAGMGTVVSVTLERKVGARA